MVPLVEAILADKTCLAMGISADKISGLWWDGFAEACADQMLDLPGDEAYVASNGTQAGSARNWGWKPTGVLEG